MLMVAMAWHMDELTASAWDLGLVGLVQFMPALLLTLLAGHAADRWPRGRIIVSCLLMQAVVAAVLGNPELRALWEKELGEMRVRIKAMRQKLVDGLKAAGVKQDMSFITRQIGMFSYSGLSKDQMVRLRNEFGVYGTDTGRMCVAALNSKNIDHVCASIAKVVQ